MQRFKDRTEAGKLLAKKLSAYADRADALILALPRGGVPVAFELANALNIQLDILLVRKLGLPTHKELAMGAIATGGYIVLNEEIVQLLRVPTETISEVVIEEQKELDRRERLYRESRPEPDMRDRTVILVDDGIATGSTMLVAIKAVKERHPSRIVVATPTAPPSVCDALKAVADEVVCLMTPEPFTAISLWYRDFNQVSDEEVRGLLQKANLKYLGGGNQRGSGKAAELTEAVL